MAAPKAPKLIGKAPKAPRGVYPRGDYSGAGFSMQPHADNKNAGLGGYTGPGYPGASVLTDVGKGNTKYHAQVNVPSQPQAGGKKRRSS